MIDGWQKRLSVAADKLLVGAEEADNAHETKKQLDGFAQVLGVLIQLEALRGAGRPAPSVPGAARTKG